MASQPATEILHIIFSDEDIVGMVEDHNDQNPDNPIDEAAAIATAHEWASSLTDQAVSFLNEALYSIVCLGQM